MKIGNFELGSGVYIIAELSANHGHDIEIAKKSIRAAKEAGADAVKLQTYTADTMTIDCDNEYFTINSGTLWDGKTFYALYEEAYTPWEWHKVLFEYAKKIGITIFSTPFDKTAVDLLESLNVPAYKVASFEIKDIPLIRYIASKGKPIILSTGIATVEDIKEAVSACRECGNDQIVLLKCTSSYPSEIKDANLNTMLDMKKRFNVEVGVSDHTMGDIVPMVSVALGATIIEKHFILDKSIESPDALFSLDAEELENMIINIRKAESALGIANYKISKPESRLIGRSLFVVEDMEKGEVFSSRNIRSIRPGYGLEPKYLESVIGKVSIRNIKRGTPLTWSLIKEKREER